MLIKNLGRRRPRWLIGASKSDQQKRPKREGHRGPRPCDGGALCPCRETRLESARSTRTSAQGHGPLQVAFGARAVDLDEYGNRPWRVSGGGRWCRPGSRNQGRGSAQRQLPGNRNRINRGIDARESLKPSKSPEGKNKPQGLPDVRFPAAIMPANIRPVLGRIGNDFDQHRSALEKRRSVSAIWGQTIALDSPVVHKTGFSAATWRYPPMRTFKEDRLRHRPFSSGVG